jgi:hypothetical protein
MAVGILTERIYMLIRSVRNIAGRCWFVFGVFGCSGAGVPQGDSLDVAAWELDPTFQIIASGLNSPRGLTVQNDGTILVAEAGIGGDGPCVLAGDGKPRCYGTTGAITEIHGREQRRVIDNLPSLATADQVVAIGPQDVVVDHGRAHIVTGLALDPAVRSDANGLGIVSPKLAMLIEAKPRPNGVWPFSIVSDIGAFETTNDPDQNDGGHIESNPVSLSPTKNGWLAVDAAGNALLRVARDGSTSLVTTFATRQAGNPPVRMESVPTAVVEAPDGTIYVGELTGFPFPRGAARVYRVARGGTPEVFATGFTNIIDIAIDNDGALLVLEIATNGLASGDLNGALWRVGSDHVPVSIVRQGLVAPSGVAVAKDGEIFVSNCGLCGPGKGSVIQVRGPTSQCSTNQLAP